MGEKGTDDLSYEDYAVEDYANGTDSGYYDDDVGYNYDESSPLTDVDYNPYDQSAQFTSGGTGTEAFDPVARDQDENAEQSVGVGIDEAGDSIGIQRSTVTENFVDDYEDESELDNDNEGNENKEDSDEDDDSKSIIVNDDNGNQIAKYGEKDYEGYVNWKPGEAITVELLNQVWDECHEVEGAKPLIDGVNYVVETTLDTLTLGSDSIIKLCKYISNLQAKKDTMSCLLELADSSHLNKRLTYLGAAVGKFFATFQPMEVFTLATLPKAMETILQTSVVNASLDKLLTMSVPMINRKHRKGGN